MHASQAYPDGTVTFLFTDIEGSTLLWERDRDAMRRAVDRHLAIIGDAVAAVGGVHFKTIGDAVQAAFHTAPDALAAAVAAQRALLAEPWPEPIQALPVRMALHAGTARAVQGDYLAPALNRLARTLAEAGVGTAVHYPTPPHRQQAYTSLADLTLPVTERLAAEVLSLPMHPALTTAERERVVEALDGAR